MYPFNQLPKKSRKSPQAVRFVHTLLAVWKLSIGKLVILTIILVILSLFVGARYFALDTASSPKVALPTKYGTTPTIHTAKDTVAANQTKATTTTPTPGAAATTTPATETTTPNNSQLTTPTSYTCTSTPHIPGGSDNFGGCWPGTQNTGVPAGTNLSAYSGPCTITTNNTVIDAKIITCDLSIQAANVKITNSKFMNGSVATDENSTNYSFTISDSEIQVGSRQVTGLGAVHFTATRILITGGNRSAHCYNACSITDSYVHGQFTDSSGSIHESGIRMGQSATIRHNTISCDAPDVAPDGGCSAPLTGYGDFAIVQNNTIDRNLFIATTGGFCAYGGSSAGKPYSSQANHIIYTNNIFQRGTRPSDHATYVCGSYGSITDFDISATGNVWTNNKFDNGTLIVP